MNGYELLGRWVVTILLTLAIGAAGGGIWLSMIGDVWNIGPLKTLHHPTSAQQETK